MTIDICLILLASLVMSALLTKKAIPVLTRLKAGQNIREDGPQSHLKKAGTPSMGGIAFIIATVAVYAAYMLINGTFSLDSALIILCFAGYGAIGFVDDYAKIMHKQNLGLRAWQKLVLQIALACILGGLLAKYGTYGTEVFIPFAKVNVDFGVMFVPFVAFTMVAMSNSVNLTDGLDGLAAGVTAIVAIFFTEVSELPQSMYFFAALGGACLGFLVYNANPAKIFMGDTGSMALGGGLAGAAICTNQAFLLVIAGLVYVIEALSVIIQVVSFRTTGKRVFRMAPIHHHFELLGLEEKRVVALFVIFTVACCILALLAI